MPTWMAKHLLKEKQRAPKHAAPTRQYLTLCNRTTYADAVVTRVRGKVTCRNCRRLMAKAQPNAYYVDAEGAIREPKGTIVYESFAIEDLSKRARKRLAQLCTDYPKMDWEAASDVLAQEGLFKPKA